MTNYCLYEPSVSMTSTSSEGNFTCNKLCNGICTVRPLLFRCESAGQPQHSDSGDSPRVWDVVVGLSNEPWWKGWLNFIYMMKRSSWWKIKAFSTNLDWCFWHFVFSVLWISLSQLHVYLYSFEQSLTLKNVRSFSNWL